ncbi:MULTISPECIES: alpha-amylase family glycosyl hydrolase [unclassified Saccharicrinis]|uniref:alpha-amylase family glycosyl hydrolase n=1 Tax=unclassified Saccharicrinis TaxID=2646859 RepID=UPI003D336740
MLVYQIFIDRFNELSIKSNSADFLGGTLSGICAKLDYLIDLGINTIWLSPFYETIAYHGYHITDFKKVDPHFGSHKDFEKLVKKAKKHNLKIIVDFVPNHCSAQHPFFQDAIIHENSKYRNWFIFKDWPNNYLCFLDVKVLPKINLDHPAAREYMIAVAHYWMSFGIDGFRIDHVIGPSHDFWKEFKIEIVDKYPEAIFIGEAWADGLKWSHFKTLGLKNKTIRKCFGVSQEKVQLEYHNELSGVLDFALNKIIVDAVKKKRDILTDKKLKAKIEKHFSQVPKDYLMLTFLDNHDMDRFLRHCDGNIQILLNAFELLFSLDHPVVIYNGTENCSYNKTPVSPSHPQSDLQVRGPFDWDNIKVEFVEGFKKLVKKYRYH